MHRAIALVLLVGAGLLLRSLTALTRVDTGIDTRNLITFDMSLSGDRAKQACRSGGGAVDAQLQSAVMQAHDEISNLKKQLH